MTFKMHPHKNRVEAKTELANIHGVSMPFAHRRLFIQSIHITAASLRASAASGDEFLDGVILACLSMPWLARKSSKSCSCSILDIPV